MKLITICNNVPDTIQQMLVELDFTSINYLEVNSVVPEKMKADSIFIVSYGDFKANLKVLNSEAYEKKTVFLFAPIIKVKYLTNALFLDLVKDGINHSMSSEYKNLSLETLSAYLKRPFKKRKVKEEDKDFKYLLIDGVRSGSLLNPLMTLLYSVKAENGVKIKEMVLNWLCTKGKIEVLTKQLKDSYDWGTVSTRFCDKLVELLSSDLGKRYKLALSQIEEMKAAGEKPNTVSIAKKNEVDDYELRYLLATHINTRKHKLDGKTIADIHNKSKKIT